MPPHTLDALLQRSVGFDRKLGVTYEKITPDEVVASFEVTPAHHQPGGYLHGGVNVALAESVASVGATVAAPEGKVAFGMEINANHVRPVRSGTLRATARPLHVGRTTQVWDVRIEDDEARLVSVARCTLAVVEEERSV